MRPRPRMIVFWDPLIGGFQNVGVNAMQATQTLEGKCMPPRYRDFLETNRSSQ
ncbi:hypothetical protein ACFSF4_07830 [Paeniglutamicibacter kerguelensis]|uniref:Uncharacterized protein n=1 Tax=Paeniglutamicibacter kerguelensis TaxID=254788 RepID=A0ABS4XM59_9MICC|nr:hypothetical protein [Paeniglutamicibacter kerguelensis]MBP2388749.1 hypothetical protein [Paeniglutamicibacter kerguelensis]